MVEYLGWVALIINYNSSATIGVLGCGDAFSKHL